MARDYFFFKVFRRTIIQFLDMFTDINIERYDVNGNVKGQYLVPLRYSPKTKAYMWVKDQSRTEEMLPMISVYITGIDFDPTRLTNKHQDIIIGNDGTNGIFARNAIPYNITFTVNMWVLHMVDVDQIYEQMLPYFTPHAFIRVNIPEISLDYDVKVILNGCSPVMTEDIGEEEQRVIQWDTIFVVQAWLFKPLLGFGPGYDTGMVNKVIGNLYMDGKSFNERDTTSEFLSAGQPGVAESIYLEGIV